MPRRLNLKTKMFVDVVFPDDWKCMTFKDLLATIINCANCGKPIAYGKSRVSNEIREGVNGTGYAICSECFAAESKRNKEV